MSAQSDLNTAIDELKEISSTKAKALEKLRNMRNRAVEEGNQTLAFQLTTAIVAMNQQNLRLWNAMIRLKKAKSLAQPLARLKSIASDARKAEQQISTAAKTLKSAAKLVQIITRVSGIFS